jgi:general secretion pathway protein F/type IV pilus assembly protein PilC
MPLFHYEAVTASGQRNAGSVEAGDRGEALRKLSRKGLQPFLLSAQEIEAHSVAKQAVAK